MPAQLLTGAIGIDGDPCDVLIGDDGRIASPDAIGGGVDPIERVDLSGHVLLPAAVEPHAHLDKAFLAEKIVNPTGDLIGAIEAVRAHRHLLTVDDTVVRAERAARLMATNGFVAVRTHADLTSEHGLTSIDALAEVRRRVADVIDVEIVALAGWPITGSAGADHRALLVEALAAGADVVGGCPHLEELADGGTLDDATDLLLEVASQHGRDVDLHTDETLDPRVAGLDLLARRVAAGFEHRVTASHCVSLGQQDERTQRTTAERVAVAGIDVVVLPHTNLFLQGRDRSPMPRGLTAVHALRSAGVNVCAGADNLQDPFNPVGRACPFETAGLMIMTTHLLPDDAWHMVSTSAASTLGRVGGIGRGQPADLVAVPGDSVREAIAFAPSERLVWRRGRRVKHDVHTPADGAHGGARV